MSSVVQLTPDGDPGEEFFDKGFADGYPVVLPTRARVLRMLRGTSLDAAEVLGQCPPSYANATVEKLAIAAVMAGSTPEMFRIVVAATRAALSEKFNLHGVHATTMGGTPMVLVNGPCRHAAGINFQMGVCGSGHRSHTVGRALKLLLQNVGRAQLGGTESTTIGNPMKFGLCFGEWEERGSMWEPLSVQHGFDRDADAVTVLAGTGGPTQLVDFSSTPAQLIDRLSELLTVAWSAGIPMVNNVLLVISPEHYDTLLKAGMDSKGKLAKCLWRRTCGHMVRQFPLLLTSELERRLPRAPRIVCRLLGLLAWCVASVLGSTRIPKFSSVESFQIVVAGSEAGKFSSFIPGFGAGGPGHATYKMSTPVTVGVEPRPAALDAPLTDIVGGGDVLSPTDIGPSTELKLASRTGVIEGPVALLDISKGRGSEALDVVEAKLRAMRVETRRYMKPTFSRPCPKTLLETISAECRSTVLGLAD